MLLRPPFGTVSAVDELISFILTVSAAVLGAAVLGHAPRGDRTRKDPRHMDPIEDVADGDLALDAHLRIHLGRIQTKGEGSCTGRAYQTSPAKWSYSTILPPDVSTVWHLGARGRPQFYENRASPLSAGPTETSSPESYRCACFMGGAKVQP